MVRVEENEEGQAFVLYWMLLMWMVDLEGGGQEVSPRFESPDRPWGEMESGLAEQRKCLASMRSA